MLSASVSAVCGVCSMAEGTDMGTGPSALSSSLSSGARGQGGGTETTPLWACPLPPSCASG